MENRVLVISKPIFNNILPLVDFPNNKDVFNLNSSLESIMGEANVAAYILGKYNIPISFAGIVGNDEVGDKFKKTLESVNVNLKYVETNFEAKTDVCHTIINTQKGGFSHIKINSMNADLTKYKYDFNPSFIVFDDKDFSGVNAALNNYPNVPAIFYGKNANKDAINMCKRADYIVCNISFASKLTGLEIQLNKPKTIVNLYQKLIDLFKGEWIITLGEYGVIYCNQDNVKMIPALKSEVVDKDKAGSVFFGTFAYSIISGMDIENAVRLANIAASSSLAQIGSLNGLIELDELLKHKISLPSEVKEVKKEQIVNQVVNNAPIKDSINVEHATIGIQLKDQPVKEELQPTNVLETQQQVKLETETIENLDVLNIENNNVQ